MAAILCPRCHKLISADESRCPYCGQLRPGLWGFTSRLRRLGLVLDFPHAITVVCVALYALALLLDPAAILRPRNPLSILSPSSHASLKVGMTGAVPVLMMGHWWTVVTAIYLHGNLLHILFNLLWVRQLGPVVEQLFGPYRLLVLFTVSGATGFAASVAMGNEFTLGASGSIFGLLAAAIVYGRRRGADLFTRQFLQWAVLLFLFGIVVPGIDNWAHGGGFAGGFLTAWLFGRRPDQREGVGTYALAGLCAAVTVLAFALQLLAALGA